MGRGLTGFLGRLIKALALSRSASRKGVVFLAKPNQQGLTTIDDLMREGEVTPVIDKCSGLNQVPAAIGKRNTLAARIAAIDAAPE
jgi:hypothetical protein